MDLHHRRSVLVRMTEAGEHLETVRISNDPEYLRAVMARAGEAPEVVLEATYGWYWAADTLAELGAKVHLAHPLGVKMFSYRRVKNGERDAADLADLLRMGRLPQAWIAPPATRELRELVRHRAKLVALRSSVKRQVHAVLTPGLWRLELLDYPDSGTAGWDSHRRDGAFCSVPVASAAHRVMQLIDRYQPQVLVTYDLHSTTSIPTTFTRPGPRPMPWMPDRWWPSCTTKPMTAAIGTGWTGPWLRSVSSGLLYPRKHSGCWSPSSSGSPRRESGHRSQADSVARPRQPDRFLAGRQTPLSPVLLRVWRRGIHPSPGHHGNPHPQRRLVQRTITGRLREDQKFPSRRRHVRLCVREMR